MPGWLVRLCVFSLKIKPLTLLTNDNTLHVKQLVNRIIRLILDDKLQYIIELVVNVIGLSFWGI